MHAPEKKVFDREVVENYDVDFRALFFQHTGVLSESSIFCKPIALKNILSVIPQPMAMKKYPQRNITAHGDEKRFINTGKKYTGEDSSLVWTMVKINIRFSEQWSEEILTFLFILYLLPFYFVILLRFCLKDMFSQLKRGENGLKYFLKLLKFLLKYFLKLLNFL